LKPIVGLAVSLGELAAIGTAAEREPAQALQFTLLSAAKQYKRAKSTRNPRI